MRLSESEGATQYTDPNLLAGNGSVTAGDTNGKIQTDIAEAKATEDDANLPEERGLIPVLKNRNFLVLWSGQVFSQLADKVYLVLTIAIIASRFQAQNQTVSGWVSAIMMAFTIPAVLFGSLAGVFVDRWPKKAILVATNLLRGILVLSIPFLLWVARDLFVAALPVGFYILLVITFLVSTLTQFFAPAEQATISTIVEKRHLLSANSLYTTTMMGSLIVGFAVGQPVLELADTLAYHLGIPANMGKELVVGGSYAIAGLLLIFLKTKETTPSTETEPPHVLQDLKDGIDYLNKDNRVRGALIQLVILFSVFAAMTVLAVRIAEILPGMKASQFGFLLAAGGVGMGCGAALLGNYGQQIPHARLSLYGSLGMAVALVALSLFTHHLWLTLLWLAVMGAFGAMVAIPMQTTIQADTPEEFRGKVFGLQNNAINIAMTLPLALTGVAETFLGLPSVLVCLAAIVITGRVLTWYICRKGATKIQNSEC
jgi:predicted MFS family arabinose efflux permease